MYIRTKWETKVAYTYDICSITVDTYMVPVTLATRRTKRVITTTAATPPPTAPPIIAPVFDSATNKKNILI